MDELLPLSKSGSNWFSMGLTLVDALDTAFIMGQGDIFSEARDWIQSDLKFTGTGKSNVFEVTIRILGSLLTSYNFTRDALFLNKAVELAD